jgi:hypothetical protein
VVGVSVIWPEDRWLHRRGPVEERELQCPACGLCWWADGRVEYGVWFLVNEDDSYCGRCGVEGEA